MKRSGIGPGAKSRERGSTFESPRGPLRRRAELARSELQEGTRSTLKRSPVSAASKAQRAKVRDLPCLVCGRDRFEVTIDPAHIWPRGMGGCDDELCVAPMCRPCHRSYDDGRLSILECLEPRFRAEMGHAIEHGGLIAVLERTTAERWRPAVGLANPIDSRGGLA